MKQYEAPEFEIVFLEDQDLITASCPSDIEGDITTPWMP